MDTSPRADVRTTHLDRRHFLRAASAAGVAVAASTQLPSEAFALTGRRRRPDLIGVEADDGSRVIAQHVLDSRTVDITIDSAALGQTASTRILLPRGFSSRSRDAWPVLYVLHGGLGSYVDWTESSDLERLTRSTDVLVVAPDGGRLGFYTDWWSHGAGNKPGWETFHLTELRQILERGLGAGRPAGDRWPVDGRLWRDVVCGTASRVVPRRGRVQRRAGHDPPDRGAYLPGSLPDLADPDVPAAPGLRRIGTLRRPGGTGGHLGRPQPGRSRREPPRHRLVRVLRQRPARPARSSRHGSFGPACRNWKQPCFCTTTNSSRERTNSTST